MNESCYLFLPNMVVLQFQSLQSNVKSNTPTHEILPPHLCNAIKDQKREFINDPEASKNKSKIHSQKQETVTNIINHLKLTLSENQKTLLMLNQEKCASSWLTTMPLENKGYHLNKQTFQDLIRIRYGWALQRTPSNCECGSSFSLEHALSCKKGGFVSMRHNLIRNFIAKTMSQVCRDVQIEPQLQPMVGTEDIKQPKNTSDEARLDVAARGFWITGQKAFFDIRVFNPLAKRYVNLNSQRCYEVNEKEKKRHYNERILEIEHASFTPMVYSATGGCGRECRKAIRRLSEMISEKTNSNYSDIISYITRKINFSLIKSVQICLRGSRTVNNQDESMFSPGISEKLSHIQ